MENNLKWLHISDIHYEYENYSTKKMRDNLLKEIDDEVKSNNKFDFIVLTGDIAYKGSSYSTQVKKFINELINLSGIEKENLFIVPGNHDLKRSQVRERLIESISKSKNPLTEIENLDSGVFAELYKGQKNFWKFYDDITGKKYDKSKIHFIEKREKFNVINLNTCLLCGQDDEEEHLSIFLDRLYDVIHNNLEPEKVNIAIGHHNIDCLFIEERNKVLNNFVDEEIDIYLCGHSHKPKFSVDNNNDREFYISMAGAGVCDEYAKATYTIGKITDTKCTITYYSWDNDDEVWNKENKGLGRKVKEGVVSFSIKEKLNYNNSDEKEVYIEEDDFKDFIIDFHNNIGEVEIKDIPLYKENICDKFKNMKCNSALKKQFEMFGKYFSIINEIMKNSSYLGIDKRIIIPNVICEEYNKILNQYNNGNQIVEEIVNNIYSRYKTKIRYSESKLKVYIKTLVFWLINECDIFDDNKENDE